MTSRVWLVCLLISLDAVAVGTAFGSKQTCSEEEAKQAEIEADNLKNWNSMYRFYQRFAKCDDGAIAEGVSDDIAKLLAHRWDSISELVRLGNRDRGFEKFVLRHVDETIDWNHDAPTIRENARLHCPSNAKRLCRLLISRTTPQRH